jgi:HTH-type transcriptional regulator/antitoxin HigA
MDDGLDRHPYTPDYAVPPGATLRETLEHIRMSQAEFARRADLSTKHVNQIIQGDAPITADTAIALELVTEVPAEVWNGLEAHYAATTRRLATRREMTDEDRAWVQAMPVPELIRRRYLPDVKDMGVRFDGLLRFFGVANRHAWMAIWGDPEASFHRSSAFRSKPEATAAWLRIAELRAAQVETDAFDKNAFKEAAAEIREWVGSPIDRELIERMQERLARAGVALVIVPEIEGSRASGATRWLSADKAMIAMSLRYKADDHFWFTFFHEVAHVLLHGKRQIFIHEERSRKGADPDGREAEADRYSSDVLIPRPMVARVRTLSGEAEIRAFADELELAPGVVLGRLQFLGVVPWKTPLNSLRHSVDPDELASAADGTN